MNTTKAAVSSVMRWHKGGSIAVSNAAVVGLTGTAMLDGTIPEYGIVVFDLAGGDAGHYFVDRDRWNQIMEVRKAVDHDVRGKPDCKK